MRHSILLITIFIFSTAYSQWTDVIIPSTKKVKLILCHNQKIYAGTAGDGIFTSTDYGATWNQINVGLANGNIINLFANDNNVSLITEDENYKRSLYLLSDTAKSWEIINVDSTIYFNDYSQFCTINDSIFLIADSYMFRTLNRGKTWEKVINSGIIGVSTNLLSYFKENDKLFISSSHYDHSSNITLVSFSCSQDKGATWKVISNPSPLSPINGIKLSPNKNLFISTFGSGVFSSLDSGITWVSKNSGLQGISASNISNYDSIILVNVGPLKYNVGYSIYISYDDGNNWLYKESVPTSLQYLKNSFVIGGYYFAFSGSDGTIIKIPIETLTNITQSQQNSKAYSLKQNYPNPFNPTTKIDFEISTQVFTTLNIYDVLGREVATLIAKELSPGRYSETWNAKENASGVYFYTLRSGNYRETKKLLLQK